MAQRAMQQIDKTRLKCVNCQITIHWLPEVSKGQLFCCPGCSDGGPCTCDYSLLHVNEDSYAIELRHTNYRKFSLVKVQV